MPADKKNKPVPVIFWFRQDLRLADNPGLAAAAQAAADSKAALTCLYVLDDETPGLRPIGGASRWWLHHSLTALGADLAKRGGRLILRRGRASAVLDNLISTTGAGTLIWNRCYEPGAIARDKDLKARYADQGLSVQSYNSALMVEPWTVKTQAGGWFQVFTPFWRAARAVLPPPDLPPAPKSFSPAPADLKSDDLAQWSLLPVAPNWATGFGPVWTPGEAGARKRLAGFIDQGLGLYKDHRDRPDIEATSRLAPHLHWGEISPRRVLVEVELAAQPHPKLDSHAEKLASELGWREFAHHLLFHAPGIQQANFKPVFDRFPWRDDGKAFTAWSRGQTGYPIVDAGMRELWTTGFLHNRVRMIVASFLTKHLMIDWRQGEEWFWDTLVDADLANNAASWQWVAGSGADAAPYFRIFAPVLQGRKFDPEGTYVRRWVPELAGLSGDAIHAPWDQPELALKSAGITLGKTYPKPIVDHAAARARALAAFETLKSA